MKRTLQLVIIFLISLSYALEEEFQFIKENQEVQEAINNLYNQELYTQDELANWTELLTNYDFLTSKLQYSPSILVEQLLLHYSKSGDHNESIIRKYVWKAVANRHKLEAVLPILKLLFESDSEKTVHFTLKLMRDCIDLSLNEKTQDWNYNHYFPVLFENKTNPPERLILYMFNHNPLKALEQMSYLYAQDFDNKVWQEILDTAQSISKYREKYTNFQIATNPNNKETLEYKKLITLVSSLKSYDKWYIRLYLVALNAPIDLEELMKPYSNEITYKFLLNKRKITSYERYKEINANQNDFLTKPQNIKISNALISKELIRNLESSYSTSKAILNIPQTYKQDSKMAEQITVEPTEEKTTNWIIYILAAVVLLVILIVLKLKKKK